jgi:hypothetical protein
VNPRTDVRGYTAGLTAPGGKALDLKTKNVDTTVDAARLEARATKRNFMARAWAKSSRQNWRPHKSRERRSRNDVDRRV